MLLLACVAVTSALPDAKNGDGEYGETIPAKLSEETEEPPAELPEETSEVSKPETNTEFGKLVPTNTSGNLYYTELAPRRRLKGAACGTCNARQKKCGEGSDRCTGCVHETHCHTEGGKDHSATGKHCKPGSGYNDHFWCGPAESLPPPPPSPLCNDGVLTGGKGEDYDGNVAQTAKGQKCVSWPDWGADWPGPEDKK